MSDEEDKTKKPAAKAKAKGAKKTAAKKPAKAKAAPKKGAKTATTSKKGAKAPTKDKAKKPAKAKAAPKKSAVEKDRFGFRKGTFKSEAAKIYSGKKGATLDEVKNKLGSSQLNLIKELEGKGFKIEREKVKGKGEKREKTRYRIAS